MGQAGMRRAQVYLNKMLVPLRLAHPISVKVGRGIRDVRQARLLPASNACLAEALRFCQTSGFQILLPGGKPA